MVSVSMDEAGTVWPRPELAVVESCPEKHDWLSSRCRAYRKGAAMPLAARLQSPVFASFLITPGLIPDSA